MRSPRLPFVAALAATFLAASAAPTLAGVTFYTSQAAWQAALGAASAKTFDFNGSSAGNYGDAAGFTLDGVNIVGETGTPGYYWLGLSPSGYCCDDYNNPNASLQGPATTSAFYNIPDGETVVNMPKGGVLAFALQAFTVQAGDYTGSGADKINLTVDGLTGSTYSQPDAVTGFIGFVSTGGPVGSVVVTGSTPEDFVDLTNVSFVPSGAPEPGTWLLMALGVFGLGATLRSARRGVRSVA